MLWRGIRKRCPVCGQGRLFRGWFRMFPRCAECGFRFDREPGYWLGSIYVNYGLTALIVTVAYFVLYLTRAIPADVLLWSLAAFCLLFPIWFFRYARSLWIALDLYFDPVQARELHDGSSSEGQATGSDATSA